MKNFKQFLKEVLDTDSPIHIFRPWEEGQPDNATEPQAFPPGSYGWTPLDNPGPKPDPNDPKYSRDKNRYWEDLTRWRIQNAIYEAYKSICPAQYGCGNIFYYPQEFTIPPPPGMQYYIGHDGRVYEWSEDDTTGGWKWNLIRPGQTFPS